MHKSNSKEIRHELVKNGKVVFWSHRKLDATFAHQKYRRGQGVVYREREIAAK